jgi:hypothetical protein
MAWLGGVERQDAEGAQMGARHSMGRVVPSLSNLGAFERFVLGFKLPASLTWSGRGTLESPIGVSKERIEAERLVSAAAGYFGVLS